VPKSSIDNRTSNRESALRLRLTAGLLASAVASVNSSTSWRRSTRAAASALVVRSTNPASLNCRGDTFTCSIAEPSSDESSTSERSARAAVAMTQSPIGTIAPVSSAMSMNAGGVSTPRSGCRQRNNASMATTRPVWIETIG